MSHSQTVQTRRRKHRARKLLAGAVRKSKKLRNAKGAAAAVTPSGAAPQK